MSKSSETANTTNKEEDSSTDNLYEKYEITEEIKVEIKEEKLEDYGIKDENLEEIKSDNLYEMCTEIKEEKLEDNAIKRENLEDVDIKKEVKNTLEENIDVAIENGTLGVAGNINL